MPWETQVYSYWNTSRYFIAPFSVAACLPQFSLCHSLAVKYYIVPITVVIDEQDTQNHCMSLCCNVVTQIAVAVERVDPLVVSALCHWKGKSFTIATDISNSFSEFCQSNFWIHPWCKKLSIIAEDCINYAVKHTSKCTYLRLMCCLLG